MIAVRSTLIVGVLVLLTGCPRQQAANRPPVTPDSTPDVQADNDARVNAACVGLVQKSDAASCRTALRELDIHLGGLAKEDRPPTLAKIRTEPWQAQLGLDADELVEIHSDTFTLLDGSYLEEGLLLRDAVRSLGVDRLPPPQQAEAAFAWISRQIRLLETPGLPVPPHYTLRRGRGTSFERSLAFLGLVRQLDLPGCIVAFAPEAGKTPDRLLPGVLVDKDIYLFDSRMGLPLPGVKPGAIATLTQLRNEPRLLEALNVDPRFAYDVTANHVANAEIYLCVPLSALSARMRYLEDLLSNSKNNKVNLWLDPIALQERFQKAAQAVPVRNWYQPEDRRSPTRLLRTFLPAEEGGVDRRQPVPMQMLPGLSAQQDGSALMLDRRMVFELQLVPWSNQPPAFRRLSGTLEDQARQMFLRIILDLHGTPRERMLRGQLDEAAELFSEKRAQFQSIADRKDPDLDQRLDEWVARIRTMQVKIIELSKTPGMGDAQKEAEATFQKSLDHGLPMLVHALHKSAAGPYVEQLKYFLALCKQERALQWQQQQRHEKARAAWQDASDWWSQLARERPGSPAVAAARALHAEALHALGDRDAAVSLFENLDGPLTPLEKTARLYRAQQLKSK